MSIAKRIKSYINKPHPKTGVSFKQYTKYFIKGPKAYPNVHRKIMSSPGMVRDKRRYVKMKTTLKRIFK